VVFYSVYTIKKIVVTIKTNMSAIREDDEIENHTYEGDDMEEVVYRWAPSMRWVLNTHNAGWVIDDAASREPEDLTVSLGTWWLCFIPDGVEESYWDISVEVRDTQATDSMTIRGYQMRWDDDKGIDVFHRLQAIFL